MNPEKARDELRSSSQKHGGSGGMKNIMDSLGLGMQADQVRTCLFSTSTNKKLVYPQLLLRFLSLAHPHSFSLSNFTLHLS